MQAPEGDAGLLAWVGVSVASSFAMKSSPCCQRAPINMTKRHQVHIFYICSSAYAAAQKGRACSARVTPASSHASPCSGEALTLLINVTLAAAPVLFAHAFVRRHMKKPYRIGGTMNSTYGFE